MADPIAKAGADDPAGRGNSKRDLPRIAPAAVQVAVTLFPWHLSLLDEWCDQQGGISRSELLRQLIRDRQRELSRK